MARTIDLVSAFGVAVRRLRNQNGLSQEGLALLANLDRTYVGGVERGERNLTLRNIAKLARALSVTSSQLLALAEEILDET